MNKLFTRGPIVVVTLVAQIAHADLSLSGQVNTAVLFGGDIDEVEIVDNTATGSRFRIKGTTEWGGAEFYTRYETQIQENESFGAVDGSDSFDNRYAEVGIKGSFGNLSLGKGDGASNATAEATYVVNGNLLGGGPLPYFTVRGTLNRDNPEDVGWTYFDGFSRVSRVRYDTPSFAGISLSASLDSGDRNEIAARYSGDVGIGKATLYVGQANSADGDNDRTMISGGLKLNFGLSFAFSTNSRTQAGGEADLDSQLLSLGYQYGNIIVSADVGESGLDGENEMTSVGVQYNARKNVNLYANFSSYDNADDSTLDASFVGARYTF
jgi:predicted porin